MQSPAELELIRRSQEGDQQAFKKLVEMHQALAYAVAFRFTGIRSEAEDITQEAFVRVWKSLGKYREGIKLSTWLYKIIMNLCLDFQKSSRHKRDRMTVEVGSADRTEDEGKRQDDAEMVSVIIKLAKTLPEKQQMVFVLRDLEMLPVDEVCEVTGMNAGKVKSNLYYARMTIREGLTKYFGEFIKQLSR